MRPPARIPSLDGLRAISIALVLVGHLAGTRGFPLTQSSVRALDLGALGVRVFFVISGFLITSLLLSEIAKDGTISLARFYLRRSLRIFPPFYVLVLAVFGLEQLGLLELSSGDLLHAVTYTTNYHRDRAWYLGHVWSLAVEEQFYLLWPFVLRRAGPARGLQVIVAYLFAAPLWRIALAVLVPAQRPAIGESFFTTADAIGAGCFLALCRSRLWDWAPYRRLLGSSTVVLLPLAVVALGLADRWSYAFAWALGFSLQNLMIMVLIDWATREPTSRVGRGLNWTPLVAVGTWSYSIYLWQQVFLNRRGAWAVNDFPWNMICAGSVAVISYFWIERPALGFRESLERRLFPPRRPAGATTDGARSLPEPPIAAP
jgi:peptidoglycan/LPS O-acetylase OafA/YrhL